MLIVIGKMAYVRDFYLQYDGHDAHDGHLRAYSRQGALLYFVDSLTPST